jgi:hypothetical protein
MVMPRNHLARMVSAAVVIGALALTGCASAGAKPSATRSAATTTAVTRPAAADGRANIFLYSINTDSHDLQAIVTGAVGDYGPAVTVGPDGQVGPGHTGEMELKLTRGSFRISIADLDQKVVKATSHEPIYPRTCSTFIDVTAAAPIVAGSGTGSYRGISGSFSVTATVDEVHVTPCHPVLSILRQVIVLAGPGTVSF